ncbi:unnamed protein product [Brassicogethes aeneus]|uniref:Mitochondrial pyruvate carrier n=1 Tax=Brassicogethes aeneus TaxID=1431903 RepID=A0A9P0B0P1_BRAAE|nr:unnamed protein product [Brassicogethes aeneus]
MQVLPYNNQYFLNLKHLIGLKTIFFWAPVCKWIIVMASITDILDRPPEIISIPQSSVLAITGCIWMRYSLVVIPKNWMLFSVNCAMSLFQTYSTAIAIK